MANTTSRPKVVRVDQLGAAARVSVASAIREREQRFGPRLALALALIEDPMGMYEPDPIDPVIGPQILVE